MFSYDHIPIFPCYIFIPKTGMDYLKQGLVYSVNQSWTVEMLTKDILCKYDYE